MDAGVAVEVKRAGVVGDGVAVQVDEDLEFSEFVEDLANHGFHFRGQTKSPFLSEKSEFGANVERFFRN